MIYREGYWFPSLRMSKKKKYQGQTCFRIQFSALASLIKFLRAAAPASCLRPPPKFGGRTRTVTPIAWSRDLPAFRLCPEGISAVFEPFLAGSAAFSR